MKNEKKETSIIPHNFSLFVGEGLTKEQADDLLKKHFTKIKCEAELNEINTLIESLKREIEADKKMSTYKQLRKKRKQIIHDYSRATDFYLGAVSNALINVLPGKSLAEKMGIINKQLIKE